MTDEITLSLEDLDALIERKMAEKAAAAAKPRKGPTPGCNCNAEGYAAREFHQFGCPWADPKGNLAIQRVADTFK